MKNEMDEAIKEGVVTDAVVCTFDVNFLKRVNDTYGHNAGDEHLKRAAETINRSFGTEGACYRTGGDEFTSLLVGINLAERLTICRDLLAQSIEEQNEMGEGKEILSMAMGFAYVSESIKHTIDSANTLADKRMYENKRSMKAERTD
jgi:diguanylate cyclase (GGDEF)-like protein